MITSTHRRDIDSRREQLVTLAHRAYAMGLVPGISGNLSVRVPGHPWIVIKATGKSLGDMTAADTVLLDLEGNVLENGTAGSKLRPPASEPAARARAAAPRDDHAGGDVATPLRPSKERFFHAAIYQRRPDVEAVVHLHPPHAVAFAAVHALPPILTGAARVFLAGKMALVPPAPSGSRELAALVGEAFRDPAIQAAILAEHGTVTVGPDLYAAFYLTQYLEDAARTACLVAAARASLSL